MAEKILAAADAPAPSPRRDPSRAYLAPLVTLFGFLVVRSAWVMDDAYITFRTVDNLLGGHGLRWNTAERVQAYTNPLWMFLVSAFALVTREIFYTTIALQIALSCFAVWWLVAKVARTFVGAAVCVLVLALSKAFVDYSTSGLENALSHVIVVLYAWVYLRRERTLRNLFSQSLLAALGLVCRLDLAILLAPPLAHSLVVLCREHGVRAWRKNGARAILLGLLPFIAWEIFSFFYYGSLIPNSARAKLTSGAPLSLFLWHGYLYFLNAIKLDPLTLAMTIAGVVFAFHLPDKRARWLAAGVCASLLYVLRVGGDHMSGRFFTVPLLASAILASQIEVRHPVRVWGAVSAAVFVVSYAAGFPTLNSGYFAITPQGVDNDIEDYQRLNHASQGLTTRNQLVHEPANDRVEAGKGLRANPSEIPRWGAMGLGGYYAGPKAYILDEFALTDPLLARLPIPDAKHQQYWKVGHYMRPVPDGYLETLKTNKNVIKNRSLASFYEKLAFVVRGPLFSASRIFESLKLGVGAYDHYLDEYMWEYNQKPWSLAALPPVAPRNGPEALVQGYSWWRASSDVGVAFSDTGLKVQVGATTHASGIEIAAPPEAFHVALWRGADVVARFDTEQLAEPDPARRVVAVPEEVAAEGYDAFSLVPVKGEGIRKLVFCKLAE